MPQKNQNIKFYYGTWAEYNALPTKNQNAFYIITDNKKIYIGDSLYTYTVNNEATTESAGLMSAADKTKLDNLPSNIVYLSHAEYNELVQPDPNTLYIFTDGGGGDSRYITTNIDTATEVDPLLRQVTAMTYSKSSGTVPITFTTTGSKLVDYSINGTYEGVGDSSINYFSGTLEQGSIYSDDGELFVNASRLRSTDYVELEAGDYLISIEKSNTGQSLDFSVIVFLYGAGDDHTYAGTANSGWTYFPLRFTVGANQVIKFAIARDTGGSSSQLDPAYISAVKIQPRKTIANGYTIPVVVSSNGNSNTTTFTVSKPLELSDTLTLSNTGVDISTSSGENTLTVNTESKPIVSILYSQEGKHELYRKINFNVQH